MPSKPSPQPSPKRTGSKPTNTHRKKQAKRTVATHLWLADDKLFHEIAARRDDNPAELLREIVHDWAVTFRLSRQLPDGNELAAPARQVNEQILADQLRPVNEILARILSQVTPPSDSQKSPQADSNSASISHSDSGAFSIQSLTSQLAVMNEQLSALKAFAVTHYMLSGQIFINTWAILYFSRYIAERYLMTEFKTNYEKEATTRRDEARLDALEWLKQMTLELGYPAPFKPILWTPPE
jgi:hypothetical protein